MVVTPGFTNLERFFPYETWHILYRVHTRLLLDKSAYALKHTLFIIDLAHTEFLSSLPSILTVDTSDLHHLTSLSRHILSSTTSSSRLPSSSSSGLPFKDNSLSSGFFIKGNTQHHIANKHHITSDLHHLPSPSSQE